MSVKRYNQWCAYSHKHQLLEKSDGELVAYSDYAALEAENADLERRYGLAMDNLQKASDGYVEVYTENNRLRELLESMRNDSTAARLSNYWNRIDAALGLVPGDGVMQK
jgi:hypothetical protein